MSKSNNHGGARPGAGRKKGSTPRYTLEELLSSLDRQLGRSYSEQVAVNYAMAIGREDWSGVRDYDRILLSKAVADKTEVTVTDTEDAIEAKQAAFREAVAKLQAFNKETK